MQTEKIQKKLSRLEMALKLVEFEKAKQSLPSQRMIAKEIGIPRTTLQHWLKRKDSIDAAPEIVAFFESPAGAAFLHRLVMGAHFVMTLTGSCGVRHVC